MFSGSLVALVTPMKVEGEIDFDCVRELVTFHASRKTGALVVAGTTGESGTLTSEELFKLLKVTIEEARKFSLPVIAGTGTNCTQKTIDFTHKAMELGADACLLVTPYYNRPTQEGLFLHYKKIAQSVPIPQILYNIPSRTACDLLPKTIARLAPITNIIGIKEGSVERAKTIIPLCNEQLNVYSGDDETALDIIRLGGKGVISVAANIIPEKMEELCRLALMGNLAAACEINTSLQPMFRSLFLETNPIPIKWVMSELGLIPPGIRLPLTPLQEIYKKEIRFNLEKTHPITKNLCDNI